MKLIIELDRNPDSMEEHFELEQLVQRTIENETSFCVVSVEDVFKESKK